MSHFCFRAPTRSRTNPSTRSQILLSLLIVASVWFLLLICCAILWICLWSQAPVRAIMAGIVSKVCPLTAEDMCSTMCTEIYLKFRGSMFLLGLLDAGLTALFGNILRTSLQFLFILNNWTYFSVVVCVVAISWLFQDSISSVVWREELKWFFALRNLIVMLCYVEILVIFDSFG